MITMWDEHTATEKKKKTPPLWRGPVSEHLDTQTHTLTNKVETQISLLVRTFPYFLFFFLPPFFLVPLIHPHKHTRPPLGPVTSTHTQILLQCKQYNLRVCVTI